MEEEEKNNILNWMNNKYKNERKVRDFMDSKFITQIVELTVEFRIVIIVKNCELITQFIHSY